MRGGIIRYFPPTEPRGDHAADRAVAVELRDLGAMPPAQPERPPVQGNFHSIACNLPIMAGRLGRRILGSRQTIDREAHPLHHGTPV
jgi:hypothetical protein